MVCTFLGHRDCYGLDKEALQSEIEKLIAQGVHTFYVGHQGDFDGTVFGCLKKLETVYPHISVSVVLAYMPPPAQIFDPYAGYSIYPEGLEAVPPKFAIEYRNKWMISRADHCICYVNRSWGGAYKFVRMCKNRGLAVTNLGSMSL